MKRAGWMKNDIKLTLIRNDEILKVCRSHDHDQFFHFDFTGLYISDFEKECIMIAGLYLRVMLSDMG